MKASKPLRLQNPLFVLFSLLLFFFCSSMSFAQNQEVELRFWNPQIDCLNNKFSIAIQAKSGETFSIISALWTIRFTQNDAVLGNPALIYPSNNTDTINQQTGAGNILYTSVGLGAYHTLTPNSWTTLVIIEFDLLSMIGCTQLNFQTGGQHPSTSAINNQFVPFNFISFENLSTCLFNPCRLIPFEIAIEENDEKNCAATITTKPSFDNTQWLVNGKLVGEGPNYKFQAEKAGDYKLCAKVGKEEICDILQYETCSNGSKGRSKSDGLGNLVNWKYQLYPNPAKEVFYVVIPKQLEEGVIQIVNLNGHVVSKKNIGKYRGEIEIPIEWKTGIYGVTVYDNGKLVFQDKLLVVN